MMSKQSLMREAREKNFKPEILEKVYRLLNVLVEINKLDYLTDKLVLKGGTALNLFYLDGIPRLSVDIDINYIGNIDREKMLAEKPAINEAISTILFDNNFEQYRNPGHHAGGKMIWRYQSALGQKGNLEIDLNYMYRIPLFPVQRLSPLIEGYNELLFPVLDIHEIAAGKFSALLSRVASRDLFDAHQLLKNTKLNKDKLRLAFVVYIAMTPLELDEINISTISYDARELSNRLLPVLRQGNLPRKKALLEGWAASLKDELCDLMSVIFPLKENEVQFITRIRHSKSIEPELITEDEKICHAIRNHPAILWAIR